MSHYSLSLCPVVAQADCIVSGYIGGQLVTTGNVSSLRRERKRSVTKLALLDCVDCVGADTSFHIVAD